MSLCMHLVDVWLTCMLCLQIVTSAKVFSYFNPRLYAAARYHYTTKVPLYVCFSELDCRQFGVLYIAESCVVC